MKKRLILVFCCMLALKAYAFTPLAKMARSARLAVEQKKSLAKFKKQQHPSQIFTSMESDGNQFLIHKNGHKKYKRRPINILNTLTPPVKPTLTKKPQKNIKIFEAKNYLDDIENGMASDVFLGGK